MSEITAEQIVAACRRWLASNWSKRYAQRDGRLTLSVRQFQWALVDAKLMDDHGDDYWPQLPTLEALKVLAAAGAFMFSPGHGEHDEATRIVFL